MPLTAKKEVDGLVTNVGYFEISNGAFVLKEIFKSYTADFILENTKANVVIAENCQQIEIL